MELIVGYLSSNLGSPAPYLKLGPATSGIKIKRSVALSMAKPKRYGAWSSHGRVTVTV